MADIGLIGQQSIVDRLTTSADCWRVSAITLIRWLLEMNEEHYNAVWKIGLILYLVIGCLIVFIQSDAVEVGSPAEYVLLPFRPPLNERGGDKGCNLPIGQKCHIHIRFQIF